MENLKKDAVKLSKKKVSDVVRIQLVDGDNITIFSWPSHTGFPGQMDVIRYNQNSEKGELEIVDLEKENMNWFEVVQKISKINNRHQN